MATKSREPFDWIGLLFLIELSLFFILWGGSFLGELSDRLFVAIAIVTSICAGSTCAICYRKTRTDTVHQWWTAVVINGMAAVTAIALIYIRLW